MAEKQEKRYVSDNAQLMAEWNWKKNNELGFFPDVLMCGSGKKVWWKCNQGHEWQAVIYERNNGTSCPYCAGIKVLKGYNDLQTVNPTLASEWHYEKNNGLTPMDVTSNSNKKVWWECNKGHEWQAVITNRNSGNGCPYCAGQKVLKGYNDLQTANPTLAKEWNYKKNDNLKPENLTASSGRKVWWKCNQGHEWQATIYSRNQGNGCPYCSGNKVLIGYNDLQTVNSNLAKEWNYERNNGLKPIDVTPNSNKKIWWKCKKGHEWQAAIYSRNKGIGCPVCNSERHTSFPEYAIVFYLKKYGIEVMHLYKEIGCELDIFIPSLKIAIEYDGCLWHKNRIIKDLEKNRKCSESGIKLYRIREGLRSLNDSSIDYIVKENQKDLSKTLEKVLSEIIGENIDVDLERDFIAIENLREYTEKSNSLLLLNPEIAKEWNYQKNGSLKPEYIFANSSKKVWWKCSKGHEWQATISSRNDGHKCPYCSGRFAIKGETDLQTANPALAEEWNYEKNDELTPTDVMPNSDKKVWWKCKKSHEWQAKIYHRNNGSGCPYCSGRYTVKGENDLQTVNPSLAKEWNYEKNDELTPVDVTPNSNKKVWWKCNHGHEWQAIIYNRNNGNDCPVCAKEKRNIHKKGIVKK